MDHCTLAYFEYVVGDHRPAPLDPHQRRQDGYRERCADARQVIGAQIPGERNIRLTRTKVIPRYCRYTVVFGAVVLAVVAIQQLWDARAVRHRRESIRPIPPKQKQQAPYALALAADCGLLK